MKNIKKHLFTLIACVLVSQFTSQASSDSLLVSNYMYEGLNYFLDFRFNRFEVKKLADDTPYSGNIVVPDSIVFEGKRLPVTGIDRWPFSNTPDLESLTINAKIPYFTNLFDSGLKYLTLNCDTFVSMNYITGGLDDLKKVEVNCKAIDFGGAADVGVWLEGVDSIICNSEVVYISGLRADGVLDFGDAWTVITGNAGYYAFGLVYGGEKLTLPGKVYLDQAALYGSTMSEVELPVLIHNPEIDETKYPYYIGNYCFYDCPNLKKLIVHDPTPWPASPEAFLEYPGANKVSTDSTFYSQCTLYVPEAAISTYKADPVWGKFKSIVPIETGVVNIKSESLEDSDSLIEYFTIDGRRLSSPEPGTPVIRRRGTRVEKLIIRH